MKCRIFIGIITICLIPSVVLSQKSDNNKKNKFTITGTVFSKDKKPVAGAIVYVDSVKTSATSDDQGRFRIKVKSEARRLSVFSVNYGFIDTEINGQTNMVLTFSGNNNDVPAFVLKDANKSASNSPVKGKKINTYTDIYQMIRHELPGVLVSGRSIVVQGPNSFFGSSQPLFVVNGAVVNSIDYISPVEVKSIELLKGSYASRYGVQGANGVISITLYKGSDK
jgi:hypothetical protein